MITKEFCSVPQQIAEVSGCYPDSFALSDGDRKVSHEQLDRRANQFARYLAQLGVVSAGAVAICMERSFDWIIAALGIMRAGAAYVPLDPAWPDSRLQFAINDSGASVLVARATLLDRLRGNVHGVDPCRDQLAIAGAPAMPPRLIQPESLAYVIYTSGSTGAPKGAEITHANLAHLVAWHRTAFGVTQRDKAGHLAGLGFDAAVWEIWPNLCAGATVCLADDRVRSSPDLIQEWMLRQHVTIAFVPTVHARQMMQMGWPAGAELRFLLTGGDTLHDAPPPGLPFSVVNNYGPTECTVVATSCVLEPGSAGTPPIGRPTAGASVYLLSELGKPVPDGSAGEIYIGGAGVGRGYRNLPERSAQCFLPDPFAATPGARMYRTGDRGVRRSDGQIEFRGRLDRQVKIRGQRVELDEIAGILAQHPAVDFATTTTNISDGGESQLVGYVLLKADVRTPTANELQTHLLRCLPEYMIPGLFVELKALPLSPNGKTDLNLLPKPAPANLIGRATAKAPASATAKKLLTIVRDLLENQALTAEDNFFLAGGHSLLAMQLVTRLRHAVGVDVTLQQLFEASSVERLAQSIENVGKHSPQLPPGVLALRNAATRQAIFWVHYLNVELAKHIGDDQSFFSVGFTAEELPLLGETPTLQSIAASLVCKILATQTEGPYTIGGMCLGGILAYEIASQLQASGREVSLLVLLDPPDPSHLNSSGSLTHKLSYLRYAMKRAARLKARVSLKYFREHVSKHLSRSRKLRFIRPGRSTAQQIIETAAFTYHPGRYEGKVLLVLASERPPHVNFLPGWQKLISGNLYPYYVDAHHRDVARAPYVEAIAQAIRYHLDSSSVEASTPQSTQ